jgi:putative aldouronate transport system substrate-binding protein
MMCLFFILSACDGSRGSNVQESGIRATARESSENTAFQEPFSISFMTTSFTNDPATSESPILKKLEEITNTRLNMIWVNNSSYNDRMNLAFASGTLPNVMLITSKSPSVIAAAKSDAFWELEPYLGVYENLRQANATVLKNISIDGKIFGIPRMRTLGRYGILYRKDWLEEEGLAEPKTIDEFYNMLKAFTEGDPNRDGQSDTYGMILTSGGESLEIMQTWFGVPKIWGEKEDGSLIPAYLTPEYKEALRFFRKLYAEKLVNQDFPVFDASRWNDPFVNGEGGCIVDVADRANTLYARMQRIGIDNPEIDVTGTVSGPKGARSYSTSGYSGFFAVARSSVRTEGELKRVLEFMDKLNDREIQDLLYYGIEGRHYIVENGTVTRKMAEGVSETERNDLSMLLTFIPRDLTTPVKMTELREKVVRVQAENDKIIVSNPAESLTSDVYTAKGTMLDKLVNEARIRYITGEIDDAGLDEALQLWRSSGGDDYIREMNEKYVR